jgi:hypothetical protein
MRREFLALAVLLTSVAGALSAQQAACGQEPAGEETPVFHGLRLGRELGGQLKRCVVNTIGSVEGRWNEECFRDIRTEVLGRLGGAPPALPAGMYSLELLHGLQAANDTQTKNMIEVLLPAHPADLESGTLEKVLLEFDIDESSRILTDLKTKYGQQPSCEEGRVRNRLGISIDSLQCVWKTSWGSVRFNAPSRTVSKLSVAAETVKYAEYLAEKESKRKPEF